LDNEKKSFVAQGNSKQNARKLVSIICLCYLIKNKKLTALNASYIQSAVEADFKTLNLVKSFEEYFLNHEITKSLNEETTKTASENKKNSETTVDIKQAEVQNDKKEVAGLKEVKKKPLLDTKTQEVIASKNVLSILNHMLQATDYIFKELEENVQFNSRECRNKLFKVELVIQKNEKFYTKCSGYEEHYLNINASKTKLIFESDTEYRFHGHASNKKSARIRSAQLALEKIFDLRIVPSDLENDFEVIEGVTGLSDMSVFSDNISEVIKEKYYNLLNLLECEIQNKRMTMDEDGIDEDLELTSQNKLRGVYAGIVQSNDLSLESTRLICVTTGTKCICGELMSLNGNAVNDW